jgi:hypothetical protein
LLRGAFEKKSAHKEARAEEKEGDNGAGDEADEESGSRKNKSHHQGDALSNDEPRRQPAKTSQSRNNAAA